MTGRIHVLTKPPEHARHQRCLNLMGSEDTLVLTGAGLQLLEKSCPLDAINAKCIIALEERPGTLGLPPGIDCMDHATFVERLLTRNQPVFW